MKQRLLTVESTKKITADVTAMVLAGDMRDVQSPGRFVNIRLEGFYLRRPISICDWDESHMLLIFREAGHGTEELAKRVPGDVLDVLMPLGNGFSIPEDGAGVCEKPVLVGGGIGVPPLYGLAKKLAEAGMMPEVVLGFNTKDEIILTENFESMGLATSVTTMDGSHGTKGLVTDALRSMEYDYIYACGPEPMIKVLWELPADGQYSFEARMACGFGACMGCSCRTISGYKRICKDGPVLRKEEILW